MKNDRAIYTYMNMGKLDIEKIMDDYTGYLWKVVQNACNLPEEDVEEIISDTYVALWNNENVLDIQKSLSSYLAGIARNLVKKKYRDVNFEENIEDFEERLASQLSIELQIENQEEKETIYAIVNNLKEEDKEIFLDFYYYHRQIKEIAVKQNISESKVKTKLHRIRKEIKKELLKGGYELNG